MQWLAARMREDDMTAHTTPQSLRLVIMRFSNDRDMFHAGCTIATVLILFCTLIAETHMFHVKQFGKRVF